MNMFKFPLFVWMLISLLALSTNTYGQKKEKYRPVPMVRIPDSVRTQIGQFLIDVQGGDSLFAAFSIYNYINTYDYKFKDGIYSIRTNSPHRLPRLLIRRNAELYFFKNTAPEGLLEEYINFIKAAHVDQKSQIEYLKVFSDFLEDVYINTHSDYEE